MKHLELGVKHVREFEHEWPGFLARFITKRFPLAAFGKGWKPTAITLRWPFRSKGEEIVARVAPSRTTDRRVLNPVS